jgi:hypothetical protein|tara:strand:+ start:5430 stop:5570 length:141 start_codon:yes stop_codon:yes gene_type:complete
MCLTIKLKINFTIKTGVILLPLGGQKQLLILVGLLLKAGLGGYFGH